MSYGYRLEDKIKVGKGHKSTDESESKAIARKLIKQGLHLEMAPGFFINRDGD